MIDVARKWEDGELKNALIIVIANHMKKCFLSWNKDTVTDEVIFNHLLELSNGELNLTAMKEELSTSQNLLKVNKKQSNKTQFFAKNSSNTNRNQTDHLLIRNQTTIRIPIEIRIPQMRNRTRQIIRQSEFE